MNDEHGDTIENGWSKIKGHFATLAAKIVEKRKPFKRIKKKQEPE